MIPANERSYRKGRLCAEWPSVRGGEVAFEPGASDWKAFPGRRSPQPVQTKVNNFAPLTSVPDVDAELLHQLRRHQPQQIERSTAAAPEP